MSRLLIAVCHMLLVVSLKAIQVSGRFIVCFSVLHAVREMIFSTQKECLRRLRQNVKHRLTKKTALVLQTAQGFKDRFNIDVHGNSEVTLIERTKKIIHVKDRQSNSTTEFPYDKLILAQGAEPFRPSIEGIHLPHVFTLQTIPDLQKIKAYIASYDVKNVAIIGGGFIGIETADALHDLGLKVTILEYTSHVFPLLDADITERLHVEIRKNGVDLLLNARIQNIVPPKGGESGHVVLADSSIRADLVVLAVGIRARTSLAAAADLALGKTGVKVNEYMQTSDPDIYAVGDMVETEHQIAGRPLNVALAGPANRQGRLAADNIFGRKVAYRGNVGTSACKVFGLTVASTGLSVHALRDMGKECEYVTVHPPDHAGYYPGT